MSNYKRKYEKARDALMLTVNYIAAYGNTAGRCLGCGEILHSGCRCWYCGCDPTDMDTFEWWCGNEIKRQEETANDKQNVG